MFGLTGSGFKRGGLGSCNGSHGKLQLTLMSQDNSGNGERKRNGRTGGSASVGERCQMRENTD